MAIYSIRAPGQSTGRDKLLFDLRQRLATLGVPRIDPAYEMPGGSAAAFLKGGVRWAGRLARGQLLPLQSILAFRGGFAAADTSTPTIHYLDSIRLGHLGESLSGRGQAVVMDFDDLMSRRLSRMIRRDEGVAFSAFESSIPGPAKWLINKARPQLLRLERRLLREAEVRSARSASAIVFTSEFERRLFERYLRLRRIRDHARLVTLGPTYEPETALVETAPDTVRFIFIGTDKLIQNRLSIEEICRLDREGRLTLPTTVYGKMSGDYAAGDGVDFAGFAEHLEDVYSPGSILFMPKSVRGGIKTKIIEAFQFGVPVIGSAEVFEGFPEGYVWRDALDRLRAGETAFLTTEYAEAVRSGRACCQSAWSPEGYDAKMRDLAALAV